LAQAPQKQLSVTPDREDVFSPTGGQCIGYIDADEVPTGMLDARQIRKAVEQERLNLLAAV
jgi:hypothetical protein